GAARGGGGGGRGGSYREPAASQKEEEVRAVNGNGRGGERQRHTEQGGQRHPRRSCAGRRDQMSDAVGARHVQQGHGGVRAHRGHGSVAMLADLEQGGGERWRAALPTGRVVRGDLHVVGYRFEDDIVQGDAPQWEDEGG